MYTGSYWYKRHRKRLEQPATYVSLLTGLGSLYHGFLWIPKYSYFNHTETHFLLSITLLYTVTYTLRCMLSWVLGLETGSLALWTKDKCPGEREFSFLLSLCPPPLFLLLLPLCLALLQKAINLGQACSNISPTHSEREICVPAELLHPTYTKML